MILVREGLSHEGSKVLKVTARPHDLQRPPEVGPGLPGRAPPLLSPSCMRLLQPPWAGIPSPNTLPLHRFEPLRLLFFCPQCLPHSSLIQQIPPDLLRFTWSFSSFMRPSLDTGHPAPPTQAKFITHSFPPSGPGILTHVSGSWVKGSYLKARGWHSSPYPQHLALQDSCTLRTQVMNERNVCPLFTISIFEKICPWGKHKPMNALLFKTLLVKLTFFFPRKLHVLKVFLGFSSHKMILTPSHASRHVKQL